VADPSKYTPGYNFSGYQAQNPSTPLPAARVDIELASIAESTEELRDAVMDIRRSDGQLKNQSVGPDQISPALSLGFTNRGAWAEGTDYSAADGAVYGTTFYSAAVAHTSSAETRPDLDSDTWHVLFTFESIIVADGAITPAKLSADAAGFRTKIGLGTLAVEDVAYLDSRVHALTEKADIVDDDEFALIDSEASNVGKKITWGDMVAAVVEALGPSRYIGEVIELSGPTLPPLCIYAAGQNISRTTYAAYFAEVGTTYGVGDGSTTFGVPDRRGRTAAGKDNMGGTSANRLTGLAGGVNGDVLGAVGGVETHTLTTAQLATHTHADGTLEAANHGHPARFSDFNDANSDGSSGGGFMLDEASTQTRSAWTGSPSDTFGRAIGGSGALDVSGNTASAGSGEAHNNVQPTIISNFAIYVGV
jgi:microcystin-dependent protein